MSNYIYHGTQNLITLPERSVQTFPSGLVRVDRVYACRKNQVARFRDQLRAGNPLPLDDGSPAIDGLFIFPEPCETIRDDGFAEFRVSAYGRANATGTITKQGVFFRYPDDDFNYFSQSFTLATVLPSNTSLSDIFQDPNIEPEQEFKFGPNIESFQIVDNPTRISPFVFVFFRPVSVLVVRKRVPPFTALFSSLYQFEKKLNYETHTSQSFGFFTEYLITYQSPAPEFLFSTQTNVNVS